MDDFAQLFASFSRIMRKDLWHLFELYATPKKSPARKVSTGASGESVAGGGWWSTLGWDGSTHCVVFAGYV